MDLSEHGSGLAVTTQKRPLVKAVRAIMEHQKPKQPDWRIMTSTKIVGAAMLLLLIAGAGGVYAFTSRGEVRPDFVAVEGANMSTLKWKGGDRYENIVNGRTVATLGLAKVGDAKGGGVEYEFQVLNAEPGVVPNFNFHLSPVTRYMGVATGNIAFCDLCGNDTVKSRFAPMYSAVWPNS